MGEKSAQNLLDSLLDLFFWEKGLMTRKRGLLHEPVLRNQLLPLPAVELPIGDIGFHEQILLGNQFIHISHPFAVSVT